MRVIKNYYKSKSFADEKTAVYCLENNLLYRGLYCLCVSLAKPTGLMEILECGELFKPHFAKKDYIAVGFAENLYNAKIVAAEIIQDCAASGTALSSLPKWIIEERA